ncbi:MAG: hypothetical protein RLZ10_947, partial [Bacteroidota bacterium]
MFIAKTNFMKTILSCIVFFFFFLSNAQKTYWQQRVDYSILATVKDASDQLVVEETLIYENNSPDTLKEVYFHLYWNAFKKESHAFEDNKIGSSAGVDF